MLFVIEYSILLISIFLIDCSSSTPDLKVEWLIKAPGEDIMIKCAPDKAKQNGVAMFMSKKEPSTLQEIFYVYEKLHNIKFKTEEKKFNVIGTFPELFLTFSNATAADTGLYWCEFNLEEKKTHGVVTFLSIEMEKQEKPITTTPGINVECPELLISNEMILCFCAFVLLLFIISFICMTLKMKRLCGKRKYKPSNSPSDSVYEDMRRNNVNINPTARSFINPDYQTNKELR